MPASNIPHRNIDCKHRFIEHERRETRNGFTTKDAKSTKVEGASAAAGLNIRFHFTQWASTAWKVERLVVIRHQRGKLSGIGMSGTAMSDFGPAVPSLFNRRGIAPRYC